MGNQLRQECAQGQLHREHGQAQHEQLRPTLLQQGHLDFEPVGIWLVINYIIIVCAKVTSHRIVYVGGQTKNSFCVAASHKTYYDVTTSGIRTYSQDLVYCISLS